ncbi:MacS family sensor histidine kinase [Janibacter anophelis]|uniref:MacS family sensor histidine kinase n=1 Tax=Janibacter anophelis TaxID=319054 RepID=UPI003F7F4F97
MLPDPGEVSLRRQYNPSPLIDSAGGRGLALYRFVSLTYAGILVWSHREHVVHWWPILVWGVVALASSIIAPLLPRPTRTAIGVELVIACAGILLTSEVYTAAEVSAGISTVPGVWAASPVMAGALLSGIPGGVICAAVISVANLVQVEEAGQLTWHNIFLLFIVGILVGLAVQLARESQKRLEQALAVSERLAERERIGRQVHDGVLQALAMINRRGRTLGAEGEALADLAADQERSLRSLITRFEPAADAISDREQVRDLAAGLAALRSADVEVVLPAGPVRLPEHTSREIEAAVAAALDNVAVHAGDGARAWVLLDADDRGIEVVIRDNGVGMPGDRLVRAVEEGRLGASSSIRGRMLDLGGDASWRSPAGGGTTVTLTVPAPDVAGSTP